MADQRRSQCDHGNGPFFQGHELNLVDLAIVGNPGIISIMGVGRNCTSAAEGWACTYVKPERIIIEADMSNVSL